MELAYELHVVVDEVEVELCYGVFEFPVSFKFEALIEVRFYDVSLTVCDYVTSNHVISLRYSYYNI